MADRKGPSAVSSVFIWLAYLSAIAGESLLLCKTWWEFAALVGIGVAVFFLVAFFIGLFSIKRHGAVHVLLIAVLVLSAMTHLAIFA
ncbi:MAG: hypothetical protein WCV69_03005 [Patescibacteria group bacterium]|jgi:hypothetical protein